MSATWRLYGKRDREPVPCFGCGLPSSAWFPDGSPKWEEHSHGVPLVSPYYEDDLVTLYLGDYQMLGDLHADVLVMDPPFDVWSTIEGNLNATTTIAIMSGQNRDAVHAL